MEKGTRGKHVHFIGICGVAIAPVAKMLSDLGYRVSGSDAGFFPPVSGYLKAHPEIEFYPGFHPEKVGKPEFVVVGNFIGPSNPEVKYVIEQGIPRKSFPQVLEEYVIKENSIVVVGTFGKTTIAALLALILEKLKMNPSYMSGGILKDFSDGVRATESEWSVVEGDEYPADRWTNRPKFFYYHPKYLILTSVKWDHMDFFKTEGDYVSAFKELVRGMPKDGLIVANKNGDNVGEVVKETPCRVVYYERPKELEFTHGQAMFRVGDREFKSSLIGEHMMENIAAAVMLCKELGFDMETVQKAVEQFQGVRRRLEVRGKTKMGALVADDLAHSPTKARASLEALKKWHPKAKVIAVFEPNVGARTEESLPSYNNAFDKADEVVIPRLSAIKTKEGERRLEGEEIAQYIAANSRFGVTVSYLEDDDKLVEYVNQKTQEGDVIVFLGSHGFRGMMEALLFSK